MRLPLTFSRTSIGASAFFIAFVGPHPTAFAADDPVAPSDKGEVRRRSPNLILGVGVGYANHWGKRYEVDTVSGASAPVDSFREDAVALNVVADFAAVDLGPGNLGVTAGYTLSLPPTFMNFTLEPRYRLRFPLQNPTLRSIEPWVGLGVAFAFREKIDKNYYVWAAFSAGCDLALGDRLYAGIAVNVHYGNPKGVTHTLTDSAGAHKYEDHMDNLETLLRVSYLVF